MNNEQEFSPNFTVYLHRSLARCLLPDEKEDSEKPGEYSRARQIAGDVIRNTFRGGTISIESPDGRRSPFREVRTSLGVAISLDDLEKLRVALRKGFMDADLGESYGSAVSGNAPDPSKRLTEESLDYIKASMRKNYYERN